jgi:hypothetical protein
MFVFTKEMADLLRKFVKELVGLRKKRRKVAKFYLPLHPNWAATSPAKN